MYKVYNYNPKLSMRLQQIIITPSAISNI